mmetsp:Transcript_6784/g.12836  ORF Transcript_6784/g.12836 Transcript_6784/m.12836 type:complete len:254 (+) Transcript_6784:439-1200(+)
MVETLHGDHRVVDLIDPCRAAQHHGRSELVLEQLKHPSDPLRAITSSRVDARAANQDGLRAEGDGLKDIGSASHPSIHKHLHLALSPALFEGLHDLGEGLDARSGVVELAASVVGDDDAVCAVLVGKDGILRALDSLDDDLHRRHFLQRGDVRPVEGRVDEAREVIGGSTSAVALLVVVFLVGRLGDVLHAHVLLTPAHLRGIDSDEQGLAAAFFRAPDQILGLLAVGVDVELHEVDLARLLDSGDLLHGQGA